MVAKGDFGESLWIKATLTPPIWASVSEITVRQRKAKKNAKLKDFSIAMILKFRKWEWVDDYKYKRG